MSQGSLPVNRGGLFFGQHAGFGALTIPSGLRISFARVASQSCLPRFVLNLYRSFFDSNCSGSGGPGAPEWLDLGLRAPAEEIGWTEETESRLGLRPRARAEEQLDPVA